VVFDGLRGATSRSYAYASLRSVGWLHGCARRSMPTGGPSAKGSDLFDSVADDARHFLGVGHTVSRRHPRHR